MHSTTRHNRVFDSRVFVTMTIIVDIETEKPPDELDPNELKQILTENVADQISQYSDEDLKEIIASHRVLEINER